MSKLCGRSLASVALAVALGVASLAGNAGQARADDRDDREDVRDVKAAGREYFRACKRGDARDLRDLVTRDYVGVNGDGSTMDRTKLIEVATKRWRLETEEKQDVNIRLYGRTAIETFRARQTGTNDGNAFSCTATYTYVWVKQGRNWRLASAHGSMAN